MFEHHGYKRFLKNRAAAVSAVFLFFVCLVAVLAPLVTKHSYDEQNIDFRLIGPSWNFFMGTDSLGRDLYSRVIYGARASMSVGVITALVSLFFGTMYGSISGYSPVITMPSGQHRSKCCCSCTQRQQR